LAPLCAARHGALQSQRGAEEVLSATEAGAGAGRVALTLAGAAKGSVSGPFWPQPTTSNPIAIRAANEAIGRPHGVAPKISAARFFFMTEL